MTTITRNELERICMGIAADRDSMIRHNPIGTDREILMWMLLSCLNSYLSLSENETPCFTGIPNENTYREALLFVLRDRCEAGFDPEPIIDNLVRQCL